MMLHGSAEVRVALLTPVMGAFATADVQKGRDSTQVFQEIPQIQAALQRLISEPMLLSRLAGVQPPPAPGATPGSQAPPAASAAPAHQLAAGLSSSQLQYKETVAPALQQAERSGQQPTVNPHALAASSSQALAQEGSTPEYAPQQKQPSQGATVEGRAQHPEEHLTQEGPADGPQGSSQYSSAQQMQQSAEAREEVLQLMKHSRHLHKSAIARLPAAPGHDSLLTEGLAMIDTNMTR